MKSFANTCYNRTIQHCQGLNRSVRCPLNIMKQLLKYPFKANVNSFNFAVRKSWLLLLFHTNVRASCNTSAVEKSLCMIQWSFPGLLILDILIGRWHFDEQNNKCHCCGDRHRQYSKYPLKKEVFNIGMKEATAWQDLNMHDYNSFSNEVNNLSRYHIYHSVKVIFTKTFIYATLVCWLSTVPLKRYYSRYEDFFFFPRVAFFISAKGLRFVWVVPKVGKQKGPSTLSSCFVSLLLVNETL